MSTTSISTLSLSQSEASLAFAEAGHSFLGRLSNTEFGLGLGLSVEVRSSHPTDEESRFTLAPAASCSSIADSYSHFIEQFHSDYRNARSSFAPHCSLETSTFYVPPGSPSPQVQFTPQAESHAQSVLSEQLQRQMKSQRRKTPYPFTPSPPLQEIPAFQQVQWYPPMQPPVMFEEYPTSYRLIDIPASPEMQRDTSQDGSSKGLKAFRSLTNIRMAGKGRVLDSTVRRRRVETKTRKGKEN